MSLHFKADSVSEAWIQLLESIVVKGDEIAPRGLKCRELLNVSWHVHDAKKCLLHHPIRRLSYKFAVAEWLWIWYGLSDVKTIAQYNPNIARFSDDGVQFQGAYGPRLNSQWSYLIGCLKKDRASRQAVCTIFSPSPKYSKDIPCTLSCQFFIRDDALHTTVTMRSSDIWLGLPYDIFNFAQISNTVASQFNVNLGSITFNLGSSHLYDTNLVNAKEVLKYGYQAASFIAPRLDGFPPAWLYDCLRDPKHLPDKNWSQWHPYWKTFAQVLTSTSNRKALTFLQKAFVTCSK